MNEMRVQRIGAALGALLCVMLFSDGSFGKEKDGRLLWQDAVSGAGYAIAVAASGPRVIGAGPFGTPGDEDFYVRALDRRSGEPVWEDRWAGSAEAWDRALDVVAASKRVFVAGHLNNSGTGDDFALRAYDRNSGRVLWSVEEARGRAVALAALKTAAGCEAGHLVFVAGWIESDVTGEDFVVRAYHDSTGSVLWEDRVDGGMGLDDRAQGIAASNGRVYAVGHLRNHEGVTDYTVRAYDAASGALLWSEELSGLEHPFYTGIYLASDNARVFVAPVVSDHSLARVRAYKGKSGRLLWDERFDPGVGGEIRGLVARASRVVAVGANYGEVWEFLVKAFHAPSGRLLWEDSVENGKAWGVAASRDRVHVVGRTTSVEDTFEFAVRSYRRNSGALVWEDRYGLETLEFGRALAVAAGGRGVYAAGWSEDTAGQNYFLVRAYAARVLQ